MPHSSLASVGRTWPAAIVLAYLAAGAPSCSSPRRAQPSAEQARASIEAVLRADAAAGAARNQGPRFSPPAEVVARYADAIAGLDLRDAPADFQTAWRSHVEAWRATLPLLERHSQERDEMHALFARWLSDASPIRAEFQPLHDRIWSTWADVERAVASHGARTD